METYNRVKGFLKWSKESGKFNRGYGLDEIQNWSTSEFEVFCKELEMLVEYRETMGEILKQDIEDLKEELSHYDVRDKNDA